MTLARKLKVLRELAELKDQEPGVCAVQALLARLPVNDAAALDYAIRAEYTFSVRVLHKILREQGIRVDRGLLADHRFRRCSCDESQ